MTALIDLPPVIGHRGVAARAPENTLGGLARAAEEGFEWVEFDVRLAGDDVPVVLHDRSLVRTTGVDRLIDEVRSTELGAFDAGSWFDAVWSGERVPTLVQALDACIVLGLTPNVEIKADGGGLMTLARRVTGIIRSRWPAGRQRPLLSSFSPTVLYLARLAGYRWPLALVMGHRPRRLWSWHAALLKCASIHVDRSLATPELISRVHRGGRRVAVYTINCADEAQALMDSGVDSIVSDTPDFHRISRETES
ncbi:MAG: glycerophosphodiester phosphodiesterase family protein [bacterium]|nr:glycerophosphodiester phosphodiesterase family protein [bacterium]MDE0418579.1 glycerophosphodiester phosphodiesterase family protein [bacterium]